MNDDATARRPRVSITGSHSSLHSGAAIVHRELAARLADHLDGIDVVDDFRLDDSLMNRVLGTPRSAEADVCLVTSTPLPLRAGRSAVPIVYDVRWRWTRSWPGRVYRHVDLRSTATRCDLMLTISETVREQLRALRIDPPLGIDVLELGPGQMQGLDVPVVAPRDPSVVLVGAAPHKRNELAVELLAAIPEVRASFRIIAISVSDRTKQLLADRFPTANVVVLDGVGRNELAAALASARTYVALTLSEGFGFPYLEAAHAGCDVVAPRQALTLEVLGGDGMLIDEHDPTPEQLWAALEAWDQDRVSRLQRRALARDWNRTAAQVARHVRARLTASS